jgi:hypothetical protein
MRAIERWRLGPAGRRGEATEATAVPPELMPAELQKRMRAAFEHVRARQIEAQIPGERVAEEDYSWIRANSAAFLILEGERRGVAARLCRPYRRRRDHYRDLVLIGRLIQLEYAHLAGRVSRRAGAPSPPGGRPALNGDIPADWARPWGSGPMLEMRTTLIRYVGEGDRLARRLPARTLATTAADVEGYRDRVWSRFETAMGGYSLDLDHEPAWAPELRRSQTKPWGSLAARPRESLEARGWTSLARVAWTSLAAKPWGSLRLRAAAVTAVAVAAVGVGITVTRGPSPSSSSPSPAAIASVPELPLAALSDKSPRESHPARDRASGQPARHRSTASEQTPSDSVAPASPAPQVEGQTALASSDVSPVTSEPAPQPAPTPSPAPAPSPQPTSTPEPGPVHSLPSPVHSLPNPGSGGG